jgi:hypothetical protein
VEVGQVLSKLLRELSIGFYKRALVGIDVRPARLTGMAMAGIVSDTIRNADLGATVAVQIFDPDSVIASVRAR